MKKLVYLLVSVLMLLLIFSSARTRDVAWQRLADKAVASNAMFSQPLVVAWFYPAETTHLNPIADAERVFLPTADGSISAVSVSTGELLWKSATGADLTASPIECNGELVVAAKKGTTSSESNSGVMRVLDKKTGITLRSFDTPRPLNSLTSNGSIVYAGSEDGKVYAIRAADGATVWSFQTGGPVHGQAVFLDGRIYVGADDNNFYAIDTLTGNLVWKVITKGKITGRSGSDGKRIYFGSNDGFVYAANITNGSVAWKLRTGATVEAAPVRVREDLLIGSFDDFFYSLNPQNGNIIWKQRVTNRIGSSPIVENGNALIAPLRGRKLSLFDSKQGLLLTETTLPEDMGEIVSAPLQFGLLIIVSTDLGIVALKAK